MKHFVAFFLFFRSLAAELPLAWSRLWLRALDRYEQACWTRAKSTAATGSIFNNMTWWTEEAFRAHRTREEYFGVYQEILHPSEQPRRLQKLNRRVDHCREMKRFFSQVKDERGEERWSKRTRRAENRREKYLLRRPELRRVFNPFFPNAV